MATTAPEIKVFAMIHLEPSSSWPWVHCLTFPLDTLNKLQFTPRLYKWIRYATGVVVGAQGDLSFSSDSPHNVLEYDNDLPFESADLYYHTSDDEKRNMFPADPDMGRTIVTSSDVTVRRAEFTDGVVERDTACVLTGFPRVDCDAVHLLPHSKGDQYIEAYTRRRSRDPSGNDIVCKIDDVRNGMLLNVIAHRHLGSEIAFLMTPNFAMSTADVDPTAPPTEKRCTAHLFDPNSPTCFGDPTLRSGSLVRMPDDADDWPPNILFDAVYANAVLCHFSSRTMQKALDKWKPIFYPRGIIDAGQVSCRAILDERTKNPEKKSENDRRREERRQKREEQRDDGLDYFDSLLMLHFMVPPDKREEVRRKSAEKRGERERNRLEDKVVGWAREVANAWP